jgi:UDP-N-acetylglucosamine--N-acetylmuramyl-(pentapeptide) pyrophosphoryl-undecaprenol N-acetylglucosamine transferase
MRAVFAGGGSAGHLFPALAVAQRFLRLDPEARAYFLAARRPLDRDLLGRLGYPHRLLSASGLPYGFSLQLFTRLAKLALGGMEAYGALGRWKPQVVFGSGGYIAAAGIPAAWLRGLPTVIHASDALPDRTNRKLAGRARVITVAFAEAAEFFPAHKVIVTGQPVREEILNTDRETARRELGYAPDDFVLLVTGGSQGARSLNQAVLEALPQLAASEVKVLHLTGSVDYGRVHEATAEGLGGPGYTCREFEARMGLALAASDLVLMRAGSSSLAEAAAWGLPMLLAPLPIAGGHQRHNAKPLATSGAALMVEDTDLGGGWLAETV